MPLALAAVAGGALPATTAADSGQQGCVAPDVVGVTLAMARQALSASGCAVQVRQLPAHGQFVTPGSPDGRQLVATQTPSAGGHADGVTLSLKPLCAQPAQPGPDTQGPASSQGPTELVSGLFLSGGPVVTSPHCRHGMPSSGVLTVTTATGQPVARRAVRSGRFGVFPLKPGAYLLAGTISGPAGERQLAARPVKIVAHRTTRLNLVADVK
ncbi:MAG: hypothetical protein JWM60_636 [Solirubrobacterales bacterium]|nr:hypothetical protein [Solirubrobacterales bacterium]